MNFEDGAKLRRTSGTATAPDAPTAPPRPKAGTRKKSKHIAEQYQLPMKVGAR